MNRSLLITYLLFFFFFLLSSRENDSHSELKRVLTRLGRNQGIGFFILPERGRLDLIPSDPKNQLNKAKVELGRQLFYEPLLGSRPLLPQLQQYKYSCATCHAPAAGFQFGGRQAIGDGGNGFGLKGEGRERHEGYRVRELDVQQRKAPSILNLAFQSTMFWDGQFGANAPNDRHKNEWKEGTPSQVNHLGFDGIESQAIAAFSVHRLSLPDTLFETNVKYKNLFDKAFPEINHENRYSDTTAALAIAAYERTLVTKGAPFQKWLKGDGEALTDEEIRGGLLFFGKAKCYTCHTGPALNSNAFHALGMGELKGSDTYQTGGIASERLGRAAFTKREEDRYKFKVPQLYNLAEAEFFGHGATFNSVKEVVAYINDGIPQSKEIHADQLSPEFKPLNLSDHEMDLITSFIINGLRDPTIYKDVPRSLYSDSELQTVNAHVLDSLSNN